MEVWKAWPLSVDGQQTVGDFYLKLIVKRSVFEGLALWPQGSALVYNWGGAETLAQNISHSKSLMLDSGGALGH